MSQSDTAQLSQNKPTGVEGIRGILQFFKDGTAEMQSLLANEADVILECRFCRAMFRSVINFTAHKRQYCKGTFGAINANAQSLWEEYMSTLNKDEQSVKEDPDDKNARQKSLISTVNRRTTDIAVNVPGHSDPLILPTLPRIGTEHLANKKLIGIASKAEEDKIPDDRVVVAFPQDPNFRSKGMKMRNRRDGILASSSTELSTHEVDTFQMACLHRILRFHPELVHDNKMKCQHADCNGFKPFANFAIFAFHIGVKHSSRIDGKIPCYLCNHTIKTWTSYFSHYQRVHKQFRDEHDNERITVLGLEGRKKEYTRGRSLSPDVSGAELDEKECAAAETRSAESSPPAIQPVDIKAELEDEDDEGDSAIPMPVLPRMGKLGKKKAKSMKAARAVKEESLLPLSRCSSISSVSNDVPEASVKSLEEVLEIKFDKDISDTVEMLVSQTEETMGDKVQNEKQEEKRESNTSRATTPSPKTRKPRKSAKTVNNNNDAEEEAEDEEKGEKTVQRRSSKRRKVVEEPNSDDDDDEKPLSDLKQDEGTRTSRTRKRPGWMESESYLLDEEKVAGKRLKGDDLDPASPVKPSYVIKYPSYAKQNGRGGSIGARRAQSLEKEIPVRGRPPKAKCGTAAKKELRSSQDFVFPVTPGPSTGPTPSSALRDRDRILTPRAKKIIQPDSLPTSPGASRRKQDMSVARDASDEVRVLSNNGKLERYEDLATVPVYLSQAQKELFFAGLKPKDPSKTKDKSYTGAYVCEFCNEEMPSLKEGRRHMVAHIRVMRLRCKLCKAGAFFCTDMRMHLQDRCCQELHKAPEGVIKAGKPCMSRSDADKLTELVDLSHPGRVVFTSGHIVSTLSKVPYLPDPVIEERILGPSRIPGSTPITSSKPRAPPVRRL